MHRLAALLLVVLTALTACTASQPDGEAPESAVEETLSPQGQAPPPTAKTETEEPPSPVLELAAEVVAELGVGISDSETAIRACYRYLIETVYFADPVGLDAWRYLTDNDSEPIPYLENRALSPLLFGIGSCEDFAAAMVLLLRAAGFEAEYVAGYTLSVEGVYIDHAWAVVRLNGQWYHLDPQLEQNVMKNGMLTYRYYMRADEEFALDHKWGENLIAHWDDMPDIEKQIICRQYTPPPCPDSLPRPQPEPVPRPPQANMAEVEQKIRELQQQSGKEELPPIALLVEPPVLVAEHHITPPLLQPPDPGHAHGGLSAREAALYDQLAVMIPVLTEEVVLSLPELEGAAVKRAVDAFTGDFAQYYWVNFDYPETGEDTRLTITPVLDSAEIRRRQVEIERAATEILRPAEGLAPFETALWIHDYLAENISYDYAGSGDSGNLYGALVERRAFCDGYARAFQYLCGQAGLPCAYLTGKSRRGVDHAWNAVQLSGWHYVDVTWDRPRTPEDRVYHDYFLIGENELLRERQESGLGLMAQPGETACYYSRMNYALEGEPDADKLADVFLRQLTAEWQLPPNEDGEFAPFFLEAKVLGDQYPRWKEVYVKQVFHILRAMEARAREQGLPFAVSYNTSVRCDFNDAMQVMTFYPLVKPYPPAE